MKKVFYYQCNPLPHNYVTYSNINLENEKEHKKFEGRAHYFLAYYELYIQFYFLWVIQLAGNE